MRQPRLRNMKHSNWLRWLKLTLYEVADKQNKCKTTSKSVTDRQRQYKYQTVLISKSFIQFSVTLCTLGRLTVKTVTARESTSQSTATTSKLELLELSRKLDQEKIFPILDSVDTFLKLLTVFVRVYLHYHDYIIDGRWVVTENIDSDDKSAVVRNKGDGWDDEECPEKETYNWELRSKKTGRHSEIEFSLKNIQSFIKYFFQFPCRYLFIV